MNPHAGVRVSLKAIGCRLNEAELETWAREFQAAGHRIVDDSEPADVLVFNSCAVTQDAVRKSRNLLRRAARENPGAKLVISGCYATLHAEEARELGVDLVVGNPDKHGLVALIQRELAVAEQPAMATEPGESALFRLGRHRAFVKVQDGCRHQCTYCIVTIARGEERSRPAADIIAEIAAHQRQGLQEAVLTGVHLGGYGTENGDNLRDLIRRILDETDIRRLRLGSLEPWDIPEGFVELFADARLMPHLHLPLQSGADTVLKRMARRCRTADFERLVTTLRRNVPDINLTTDIIVGFPGETEAEWEESLAFIEAMEFGHIHVFGFSPRPGTAAARMPNPVPAELRQARGRILHAVAERHRRATLERYLGRRFPVLWEGLRATEDGRTQVHGYTPNYLKVALTPAAGDNLSHRVTSVRLTALDRTGAQLIGEPG